MHVITALSVYAKTFVMLRLIFVLYLSTSYLIIEKEVKILEENARYMLQNAKIIRAKSSTGICKVVLSFGVHIIMWAVATVLLFKVTFHYVIILNYFLQHDQNFYCLFYYFLQYDKIIYSLFSVQLY